MTASVRERAREALNQLRNELLEERNQSGHWIGELSPSALSTATAISAMSATLIHSSASISARERLRECISMGIAAVGRQQNPDGGFGDTDRSHSNIATSYLVLAASSLGEQAIGTGLPESQVAALRHYIESSGEMNALRERYGTDKTFVVPILTNLAIAGLADWKSIPPLPFEAAVFPQSMYRLLRMPVVSYAIPALVAIGQARHFCGGRSLPPLGWIRSASVGRTMKVLRRMQPESGGYLEATPLTSFVVMSLAATGRADHEVAQKGLEFLIDSMDEQGLWPIDTNLATWVTSLSMHALACDPQDDGTWCTAELIRWHLDCQHLERHPFTGAEPGGWGWSDLSGAVPDSDDTPAAILALGQALRHRPELADDIRDRVQRGVGWLERLQNRDGGWPTFCRGWGKLPFDRSSNDLTAHAMRARRVAGAITHDETDNPKDSDEGRPAAEFLRRNQLSDGSWLPLWFGNQDLADETNPVYGTSRVLLVGSDVIGADAESRACAYLIGCQNDDGGWGGGPSVSDWLSDRHSSGNDDTFGDEMRSVISSVEETALAVDALSTVLLSKRNQTECDGVESASLHVTSPEISRKPGEGPAQSPSKSRKNATVGQDSHAGGNEALTEAIIRGVEFLLGRVDAEQHRVAWPIGFYFAKLWYHERLYPLIFSVTALGKYLRATADQVDPDWPH